MRVEARRRSPLALEVATAILFLLFLFPILLVLINSGKDSFTITSEPLALPGDFLQIFRNMASIWADEDVRYGSSFYSSVVISAFSLRSPSRSSCCRWCRGSGRSTTRSGSDCFEPTPA